MKCRCFRRCSRPLHRRLVAAYAFVVYELMIVFVEVWECGNVSSGCDYGEIVLSWMSYHRRRYLTAHLGYFQLAFALGDGRDLCVRLFGNLFGTQAFPALCLLLDPVSDPSCGAEALDLAILEPSEALKAWRFLARY